MLSRQPGDRTLPTLVTLLVIGLLLMTYDIRSEGGGVTGTVRTGAQTIVAPLQKGAAFLVSPVVDVIDSLSNLATLRQQNVALQQEVAELQAELVAVDDRLARLELYEQLYELEATTSALSRTVANVIGQPDAFDGALIIDKGSSHGLAVGQPVIDTSGYVVGSVQQVSPSTATIVPITVGPSGIAVAVDEQVGRLMPQVVSDEMRLELDAQEPVFAGDRVVTSSRSVDFPAGYPVGEVMADAAPTNDFLTTSVEPYVKPDTLRVVVVLAWPPDPITAVTDATETTTTGSTTTLPADESTTTTAPGDG